MNEMIMGPNFHTLANIFLFFNSFGLTVFGNPRFSDARKLAAFLHGKLPSSYRSRIHCGFCESRKVLRCSETRSSPDPFTPAVLTALCSIRAAENRTQSTRPRSVRTTAILQPVENES